MISLTADFVMRHPGGETIHFVAQMPLEDGSFTVLFGPSGSGKTTTLRCLAGLDRPGQGSIIVQDRVWFEGRTGQWLAPYRRGVGLVFQEPCLFPHLHVADNIGYGLPQTGPNRQKRIRELIERLDLAGLENRYPDRISGGQRQRVALARALAPRPSLLLLDEPLSALDKTNRGLARTQLRDLVRSEGIPVIMVTHDRLEAASLADRIVLLHHGSVLASGPPAEIFERPPNRLAAEIVGMENLFRGEIETIAPGWSQVRVGRLTWKLKGDWPQGPADLGFWAEDVQVGGPTESIDHALVRGRVMLGGRVRLELDCEPSLVAMAPWDRVDHGRLEPGSPVSFAVDPGRLHLWPVRTRCGAL